MDQLRSLVDVRRPSGLARLIAFSATAALLVFLLIVVLVSCGPAPRPQTPAPAPFNRVTATATCERIWRAELQRAIDPGGLSGYLAQLRAGASEAQVTANVRASDEYQALHAPAPATPPLLALHADGKIFRTSDGKAWRYRGVTAFQLLDRFAKGQDIGPFLADYRGFNVLRVWPYVPAKDWGAKAWDAPPAPTVLRFLERVAREGWRVELTLLTDDDPARISWARSLVQALTVARPPNLLIEIANEPRVHKAIQFEQLRATVEASVFPFASGDYQDAGHPTANQFGTYLVHHSRRDPEWPRRAHDCLEYFTGAGPEAPGPKLLKPCVLDEPAKAEDVSPDDPDDWRGYFGAAALLGAGATFHSETGKYGQRPTAKERELAAAALEGLTAFPDDAPIGSYSRPVEASLRTYVVGGRSMVRIRPTTATPGAGWTRIGSSPVLWRK